MTTDGGTGVARIQSCLELLHWSPCSTSGNTPIPLQHELRGPCSLEFQIQWCLTKQDLIKVGFNMKGEPDPDQKGHHINPLKFITCIINLWLLLWIVKDLLDCNTGYIINLLSDNTSALSWMKLTATTKDPLLQLLACFASALLIQTQKCLTQIQPHHIPGIKNDEADALSRYKNGWYRSWVDFTEQCSRLRTCRICLLPQELLSVLDDLSFLRPIVGTFEEAICWCSNSVFAC
jgi:hypothetical protein